MRCVHASGVTTIVILAVSRDHLRHTSSLMTSGATAISPLPLPALSSPFFVLASAIALAL